MRRVETSGGVVFGRSVRPNIDIIPLPGIRSDDPVRELRERLPREPLTWTIDRRMAAQYPADWVSLLGITQDARVAIRLVRPRSVSVLDALRMIEDDEHADGADIYGDMIAALLVAARVIERHGETPLAATAAMAAAMMSRRYVFAPAEDLGAPLSSKRIDEMAAMIHDAYPPLRRATDLARVTLALARELWTPRRLQEAPQIGDEALIGAATIASIDLALRAEPSVEIAGVRLAIGQEAMPLAWLQTVELLRGGIDAATLRSLAPDGKLPARGARAYIDLSGEADRADMINGLAASLIREADEQAAFVPFGTFRLRVPDELTVLREAGIGSCTISANPDWLWVRVHGDEDGGIFRWTAQNGVEQLIVMRGYAAWLNLALAALWHDLRVAGEESIVPREKTQQRSTGARSEAAARPAQKSEAMRVLPSFHVTGRREWSTAVERAAIARRVHGVRGHLRRLPETWTRSADATAFAREYGLVLPDGFTFVRPHMRGVDGAPATPEAVTVRSRGLASVMALLL
mgnify:CR=1 FL=1